MKTIFSETEIVFLGGVNDGELDNVEMFSEIQGWTTLPQMTSTRFILILFLKIN